MAFDSHVVTLVEVAARLVNALTAGEMRGQRYDAPSGAAQRLAAAEALGGGDRRTPNVGGGEAATLADLAIVMREVFAAVHGGEPAEAAARVNLMLRETGARPQLDPLPGGGWHVHFHGYDDTLATGWSAGCATGLALALGSDLAGRLGVCDATRCDQVYVDLSKNRTRRFCSLTCQNRVKAAAFRARR